MRRIPCTQKHANSITVHPISTRSKSKSKVRIYNNLKLPGNLLSAHNATCRSLKAVTTVRHVLETRQ